MAIQQFSYDIPDDVLAKVAAGIYKQSGGIIRKKNGRFYKQYDPIDPIQDKSAEMTSTDSETMSVKAIAEQTLKFIRRNKKAVVTGGIIIVCVAAGGIIYHVVKNREPEVLAQLREVLYQYLSEIKSGNLKLTTINDLMDALEAVKQHKNYDKFKIELSAEDLRALVNRIHEYTIELARINNVELVDSDCSRSDDSIVELERYLQIQKHIFEKAA